VKVAYAVPHLVVGAVGQRVLGVSRAMLATGHVDAVTVLGPAHDITDTELLGVGFRVVEEIGEGPRTATDKTLRRLRLGSDTVAALDAMAVQPDLVIVYGGGALYMHRLQNWARGKSIRIAADIVEWYDPSHLPMGRLGPLALDNHLMMSRVAARCDGILAVSSFLARHFSHEGVRAVMVVPPVLDTSGLDVGNGVAPVGRSEFVYCGDPGRKDRLDLVLRAAIQLDQNGARLRFTVAGPDPLKVAQLAGVSELPPVINAVGRVSRAESLELVRHAHWMPLIRDDRRFAHAGFPTKLVEAMSVGTPILGNITSDIGEVLKDGVSGIVAEGATLAATSKAIARALEVSGDRHDRMRQAVLASAREFFDYRQYVASLDEWLNLVMSGER